MADRSASDRLKLNHFLQSRGFASIDEPELVHQLAFLVQGHDHLRSLLLRCEPEKRRNMYESMRPYLNFPAKALDAYVADAAGLIAAEESHSRPIDLDRLNDVAKKAIEADRSNGTLTIECHKCTRVEVFMGRDHDWALNRARLAGWVPDLVDGKACEMCPKCAPALPAIVN